MKKILIFTLFFFFFAISVMAQQKVTCKGTTTKGTACQLAPSKTANDGYCHHHSPSKVICGAPTKSGKPCQIAVKEKGQKCHLHRHPSNKPSTDIYND